ncbi:MAG: hypothetical protein GYB65_11610 [Chloroflexi bacterium]|nr:hypothetical protein [Chloroflexota bacterium]
MSEEQEHAGLPVKPQHAARGGVLQSNFSRITLIVFAVVVVLFVAGILIFLALRSSKNKPLDVAIYPDAVPIREDPPGSGDDYEFRRYLSADTMQAIESFYAGQNDFDCTEYYGNTNQQVNRIVCQHDEVWLDMTRSVIVTIAPLEGELEEPLEKTSEDFEAIMDAQTVINIQRYWGN